MMAPRQAAFREAYRAKIAPLYHVGENRGDADASGIAEGGGGFQIECEQPDRV